MHCNQCSNSVEAGDIFCETCGQKIDWSQNTPSPCNQCGYAIETGDAFCENCGKSQALVNSQAHMPLVFLLDTSTATSSYISQLNNDLNSFKGLVCGDAQAKNILDVAVIQFNDSFYVSQDFAPIEQMPPLRLISGGQAQYSTPTREAIRMAETYSRVKANTYKPWIVLVSGSEPSDNIATVSNELQSVQNAEKLRFIALGAGSYNASALKQLTDIVFRLDGTDFSSFFSWVSRCIGAIARSSPDTKPQLPQLQGNVYRDI